MELKQIKTMPTVRDNVHESVYRSYQILELVKEMLLRKDSKETIIEIIKYLEQNEELKFVIDGEKLQSTILNRDCGTGNNFL